MKALHSRAKLVLGLGVILLFARDSVAQKSKAAPTCNVVTFDVALNADDRFERRINSLTFKIASLQDHWGWTFSLENSAGRDFIYPVNLPLRFNASQTLGRGYGYSARESLKYGRELRFLLNQSDYDRLGPLLNYALWPYSAPRPVSAADEYLTALSKIRTGLLRVEVLRSDVAADDAVRSAEFQIQFIAPMDFHFEPSLKPRPVACPSKPKP